MRQSSLTPARIVARDQALPSVRITAPLIPAVRTPPAMNVPLKRQPCFNRPPDDPRLRARLTFNAGERVDVGGRDHSMSAIDAISSWENYGPPPEIKAAPNRADTVHRMSPSRRSAPARDRRRHSTNSTPSVDVGTICGGPRYDQAQAAPQILDVTLVDLVSGL